MAENIKDKYFVKSEKKSIKAGCWDVNIVSIYKKDNNVETKIGEYQRNYPSFAISTFLPFTKNSKDFALYSHNYLKTSVMELESCKEIATEKDFSDGGFCPMEYYVIRDMEHDYFDVESKKYIEEKNKKFTSEHAFVSGCYWGDDSGGNKLQYLDISQIENGIIKRLPERFGYFETSCSIKDNFIENEYCDENGNCRVGISQVNYFNLKDGKKFKSDSEADYIWKYLWKSCPEYMLKNKDVVWKEIINATYNDDIYEIFKKVIENNATK